MPTEPVKYARISPLDKLNQKLIASSFKSDIIDEIVAFIKLRQSEGAQIAALPNLTAFSLYLRTMLSSRSPEDVFPLIDLFRMAAIDSRVCAWFAEEQNATTVKELANHANKDSYQTRLLTLQLFCNFFSNHLFLPQLCGPLAPLIVQLVCSSLLDSHANVRVAAGSLVFDLTCHIQQCRSKNQDILDSDLTMELTVALIEGISCEKESMATLGRLLAALGFLIYCTPSSQSMQIGEIVESLEAASILESKSKETIVGEYKELCLEVKTLIENV